MERDLSLDGESLNRLKALEIAMRQARELNDVLSILDDVALEIRSAVNTKRVTTRDIQIIALCLTDSQLLLNELAHGILRPAQDVGPGQNSADLADQCRELESSIRELRNDLDLAMRGY